MFFIRRYSFNASNNALLVVCINLIVKVEIFKLSDETFDLTFNVKPLDILVNNFSNEQHGHMSVCSHAKLLDRNSFKRPVA